MVKSRETFAPAVAAMSVTAPGCASHVTVCAVAWKCHVMVDVPASLRTVTADGSNAKPVVAVTSPVADGVITVKADLSKSITYGDLIGGKRRRIGL